MRTPSVVMAIALAGWLGLPMASAQDVLYRCESAAGVSIQGTPCPKGVAQRRIAVQRPVEPPPPVAAPTPAPTTVAPSIPLTPASAMRGPGEPYPLWTCMRADGSTFDSRDGVPGRQWVLDQPADADGSAPLTPPPLKAVPKGGLVIPIEETTVGSDDKPAQVEPPPPAGAAAGHWVADQCERLDPQQACDRFAVRRDALRKQIYAAPPSQRATYAPEEQDLTAMLFAACRR